MSKCVQLDIFHKTTKVYELLFCKDGQIVDITEYTVYFTAKKNMTDSDANAVISKVITDHESPTSGKTVIELTPDDTDITPGNYHYSIDFKDGDGNQHVLYEGRLRIKDRVRD